MPWIIASPGHQQKWHWVRWITVLWLDEQPGVECCFHTQLNSHSTQNSTQLSNSLSRRAAHNRKLHNCSRAGTNGPLGSGIISGIMPATANTVSFLSRYRRRNASSPYASPEGVLPVGNNSRYHKHSLSPLTAMETHHGSHIWVSSGAQLKFCYSTLSWVRVKTFFLITARALNSSLRFE